MIFAYIQDMIDGVRARMMNQQSYLLQLSSAHCLGKSELKVTILLFWDASFFNMLYKVINWTFLGLL